MSAVIKMAVSTRGGDRAHIPHEIRPIDALRTRKAERTAHPYERHPIGGDKACPIMDGAKRLIRLTFDHSMSPCDANVVPGTGRDPVLDLRDRIGHGNGAHADAKD